MCNKLLFLLLLCIKFLFSVFFSLTLYYILLCCSIVSIIAQTVLECSSLVKIETNIFQEHFHLETFESSSNGVNV
ncbi:hypothetical protein RJT34_11139 [Clitoria ternatea]|uniref:Uncharacterized protein n=1 Tax=Clitoria ternatea TaxID=43366 RepID=A0AAN9JJH9_CLITE